MKIFTLILFLFCGSLYSQTININSFDKNTKEGIIPDSVVITSYKYGKTLTFYNVNEFDLSDLVSVENTASSKDGIELYPNPAEDNFVLNILSKSNQLDEISIYDIYGKIISRSSITLDIGLNSFQVSMGKVSPGVYFIRSSEYTKQFIYQGHGYSATTDISKINTSKFNHSILNDETKFSVKIFKEGYFINYHSEVLIADYFKLDAILFPNSTDYSFVKIDYLFIDVDWYLVMNEPYRTSSGTEDMKCSDYKSTKFDQILRHLLYTRSGIFKFDFKFDKYPLYIQFEIFTQPFVVNNDGEVTIHMDGKYIRENAIDYNCWFDARDGDSGTCENEIEDKEYVTIKLKFE